MFTHSKTSFNTWSALIACELNGLSLEQDSVATGLSVTTCFHMRHKLYQANIEEERMQASIAVTKEE